MEWSTFLSHATEKQLNNPPTTADLTGGDNYMIIGMGALTRTDWINEIKPLDVPPNTIPRLDKSLFTFDRKGKNQAAGVNKEIEQLLENNNNIIIATDGSYNTDNSIFTGVTIYNKKCSPSFESFFESLGEISFCCRITGSALGNDEFKEPLPQASQATFQ